MPTILASQVTTGARLRQFVLELLRERGLYKPGAFNKHPLDDYLSALWQASQPYRNQPFRYPFIAELLERAFDAPPMPCDWKPELRQPYQKKSDRLHPNDTPEYYAEGPTYELFERTIKRQILDLKRLRRQPPRGPLDDVFIDGIQVYWANTDVEGFLERATIYLEEDTELELDASWRNFTTILRDGQLTE